MIVRNVEKEDLKAVAEIYTKWILQRNKPKGFKGFFEKTWF